jgi:hypothetical protein
MAGYTVNVTFYATQNTIFKKLKPYVYNSKYEYHMLLTLYTNRPVYNY